MRLLQPFELDLGGYEFLAAPVHGQAVVAGIRLGWLDAAVEVHTRGGDLSIEWAAAAEGLGASVFMTGPAETVYQGEIEL